MKRKVCKKKKRHKNIWFWRRRREKIFNFCKNGKNVILEAKKVKKVNFAKKVKKYVNIFLPFISSPVNYGCEYSANTPKLLSCLEEDCEHDDGERGGDEHLLGRDDLLIDHLHQAESDRAPEAAVSHDELLLQVDLVDPPPIRQEDQSVNACMHVFWHLK